MNDSELMSELFVCIRGLIKVVNCTKDAVYNVVVTQRKLCGTLLICTNCFHFCSRREYGRQQLAVKICSCPKRDKVKEEDNELEKEESASRVISAASSNIGPSMVCVRNASATSNSHGEPLRDIRVCILFSMCAELKYFVHIFSNFVHDSCTRMYCSLLVSCSFHSAYLFTLSFKFW